MDRVPIRLGVTKSQTALLEAPGCPPVEDPKEKFRSRDIEKVTNTDQWRASSDTEARVIAYLKNYLRGARIAKGEDRQRAARREFIRMLHDLPDVKLAPVAGSLLDEHAYVVYVPVDDLDAEYSVYNAKSRILDLFPEAILEVTVLERD